MKAQPQRGVLMPMGEKRERKGWKGVGKAVLVALSGVKTFAQNFSILFGAARQPFVCATQAQN